MLYDSLVLSLLLVVGANLTIHERGLCYRDFAIGCLGLNLCLAMLFAVFPPVLLLGIVLPLLMLPWYYTTWPPWRFLPVSVLAFVLVFGGATLFALGQRWQRDQLRSEFPFESMEERLAGTSPAEAAVSLARETMGRLENLESNLTEESYRSHWLRRLHEDSVRDFVASPGFGVSRTPSSALGVIEREDLAPADIASVPQPLPYGPGSGPVQERRESVPAGSPRHDLHLNSVLDFVQPSNWGYFKDRRQVTGFQSHRFSRLPTHDRWAARRVDLVGLLLHEKPVAYITANLPRMDEVKKASTRRLDGFEAWGLEKLRGGDDLVLGESAGRVRMLGALRAAKQCAECHGCERGALLGAFSYWLRRGRD